MPYTTPYCRAVTLIPQGDSVHPGVQSNTHPELLSPGNQDPVLYRDSQQLTPSPVEQNTLGAEIPSHTVTPSGCFEVQPLGNPPVEDFREDLSEGVKGPSLSLETRLSPVELRPPVLSLDTLGAQRLTVCADLTMPPKDQKITSGQKKPPGTPAPKQSTWADSVQKASCSTTYDKRRLGSHGVPLLNL